MTGSVVVVGSLNTDLTVRCSRLPGPGETLLAETLTRGGGGKGANQAVGAARAGGAAVTMVGAVGLDADGTALLEALESDGIDVAHVGRVDSPTGTAIVTVDARGENTIVVAAGANADVVLDAAARDAVLAADVVLAQLEIPQTVVAEAAAARRGGAPFVLNAAPSAPLLPELAAQVDLLVVNEHEATDLAGTSDVDTAVGQLLATVPAVLVTLGAAGSRLHRRGQDALTVPAPVVEAVDSVAAGDTYCGVLAARLATGAGDLDAMRAASAAASLAVQRVGAQPSVPSADETVAATTAAYGTVGGTVNGPVGGPAGGPVRGEG